MARGLTLDQISAAQDLEIEEVDVPEWGGSVFFRVLPADKGLALMSRTAALPEGDRAEALFLMLAHCLCSEDGTPFVTDDASEADAIARLRGRSQKVLLRLQRRVISLQGWNDEQLANPGKVA